MTYSYQRYSIMTYYTPMLCIPDFTMGSNESKIRAVITASVLRFCGPDFSLGCHVVIHLSFFHMSCDVILVITLTYKPKSFY